MKANGNRWRPGISEALEPRTLFADGTLDVVVGTSGARSVSFIDADGTVGAVSLRGGTATIRFTGEGLVQRPDGAGAVVEGRGVAVASVVATGTTRGSVLAVDAAGGDDSVGVNEVRVEGPLRSLQAPGVVLTGVLNIAGPVRQVELRRTENAAVGLGAGPGAMSLAIGEVVDTDITSGTPIQRLRVGGWGGPNGGGTLTAPAIRSAIISGVFAGDILAGSIGFITTKGFVNATIRLSGSLGRLEGWVSSGLLVDVAGDIRSLDFQHATDTRVYAGIRPLPESDPVPAAVSDFVAPRSINRVRVHLVEFCSSLVFAAKKVGVVSLTNVDTGPTVFPTTFCGDRIGRVGASFAGNPLHVRVGGLDNEVRQVGTVDLRAI